MASQMHDTRMEGGEEGVEESFRYDVNGMGAGGRSMEGHESEGYTGYTREMEKNVTAGDGSQTPEFPALGPVLVIGGCGFLGSNLIHTLLADPESGPISVISRTPNHNRHEGASYFSGDISNETRVRELLFKIQPRIIFHCASPPPEASAKEQNMTNIKGTQILLKCAAKLPFVRAFVYTSSHEAVELAPTNEALTEEKCRLFTEKSNATPHQKSKGIADALVLAANSEGLKTATLRIPAVYGEGDPILIPRILALMRQGKHTMQIGPNKEVFEHIYVGNAVSGHILCAKALLSPTASASSVAGESFFLTDDQPMPYYTFARKIWYIAGDRTEREQLRMVSFWLVIVTAWMNEVFYFVFTVGMKRPAVGTNDVGMLTRGTRWSVEKARVRLGFRAEGMEEGLRRGVEGAIYEEEMRGLVERTGGGG